MNNMKYEKELEVAVLAAKTAGNKISKYFKSKDGVIRKSLKELVTKSDIESQSIISMILMREFPQYDILSEEKIKQNFSSESVWIVDPIDGTHNFVSGIPFFGISIGLIKDSEFQLGVIYLPLEEKLFTAIRGQGAFCNNVKIQVSPNDQLKKAMITYDNQFYLNSDTFENYQKLVDEAFTTRILGSAVRDFCFIAEGIVDGRIWNSTKLCDIAAGSVILEEAGGKVTDFQGNKITINSKQIIASNKFIHNELLNIFNKNMNKKPIIGITLGDPAGIGGEITAKLLSHQDVYNKCHPVVIGDADVLKDGIRIAGKNLEINIINDVVEAKFKLGVIDIIDLNNITLEDFEYGKVSAASGRASGEFIKMAINLAIANKIDAVVTNPINKEAFKLGGFGEKYPGHTEMFADLTNTEKYSMMLAHENLRVFHVTTHVPFSKVIENLSINRITDVIKLAYSTCKQMGIDNPKIGVAGLNPHAGDNGLFGNEDEEIISPAIEKMKAENISADGPIPPDTLFCKAKGGLYDAVVVMYHDQGHIPVKYAGFAYNDESKEWIVRGINVTLGLPIIRTSVDHGTAYGKAGQGRADHMSLYDALDYAVMLAKHRLGL